LSGGLAEHCHLVRGSSVLRLSDELPDAAACPANCATATVAAALGVAGECGGRVVLIQGAGMLGLTAAAMARSRGAREVIVAEPDRARLERAEQFGATRLVPWRGDVTDLAATVKQASGGRGVDIALELSGAPQAMETALPLLGIGARYVLVGAVFPDRDIALSAETIVRRLVRIEGVHNYTPADLVAAVEFLTAAHARYPLAELVSERFALADAEAAFRHAVQTKAPRVAVAPRG
jgi:alcohol dehydrogenase